MQISLRVLAAALAAAVVAIVAAVTLGITVSITSNALQRLGVSHANTIADTPVFKLSHFFNLPSLEMDIRRNASRTRTFTLLSTSDIDRRLWLDRAMFGLFFNPGGAYCRVLFYDGTSVDGNVLLEPTPSGKGYAIQYLQTAVDTYAVPSNFSTLKTINFTYYTPDLRFNRTNSTSRFADDVAALLNVDYLWTLQGTRVMWNTLPTVSLASEQYIMSFSGLGGPLRDKENRLVGYSMIGSPLYQLSDFLLEIRGTPSSYGFIIDAQGFLLGSSHPIPFQNISEVPQATVVAVGCEAIAVIGSLNYGLGNRPMKQMICRKSASTFEFAPLRAVAADEDLMTSTSRSTLYKTLNGDGYFVVSLYVPMRYPGFLLRFVMIMPEVEVVGDLVTPRNLAVGISVATMVVAAAVAMGIVTLLLSAVSNVAMELSELDLDADAKAAHDWSHFSEVQCVEAAYTAMKQELRRIKAYLPKLGNSTSSDEMLATLTGESPASLALSPSPLTPATESLHTVKKKKRVTFPNQRFLLEHVVHQGTLKPTPMAVLVASAIRFGDAISSVSYEPSTGKPYRLLSAERIVDVVGQLTAQLFASVSKRYGVVLSCHGDHVAAYFTALGSRHEPEYARAVESGLELLGPVKPQQQQEGDSPNWRVAVATGVGLLGIAGCSKMEARHIIGDVYARAALLERLQKVYRQHGVLVSGTAPLCRSDGTVNGGVRVHALDIRSAPLGVIAVARRVTAADATTEEISMHYNRTVFHVANGPVEEMWDAAAALSEALASSSSGSQPAPTQSHVTRWALSEFIRSSNVPALQRLAATGELFERISVEDAVALLRRCALEFFDVTPFAVFQTPRDAVS